MVDNSPNLTDSISDRRLITQLELACQDLLWLSEAEYPLQIVYWQDIDSFETDYLLQHCDYPVETKITIRELSVFFASVTKSESWHNEAEQLEVQRYQELAKLLTENLSETRVYLLGEVEIDVYILGKTPHQAIAGINTKIVRT